MSTQQGAEPQATPRRCVSAGLDPDMLGVPRRDEVAGVGPQHSAAEHVRAAMVLGVRMLLQHEPGCRSGDDPEDVHQARVAIRRMRAVLAAAKPILETTWAAELRADLGTLGRSLGGVRDCDVELAWLDEQAAHLPHPDAVARLRPAIVVRRSAARDTMMAMLTSDFAADLQERLGAAATSLPTVDADSFTLWSATAKRYTQLAKGVRAAGSPPTDDQLHELRIRAKKLRYTGELTLATLQDRKPLQRVVKSAAALQKTLGEHQDAAVLESDLYQLAEAAADTDAAFAAGRLAQLQTHRRLTARQHWLQAWEHLHNRTSRAGFRDP